MNPPVTFRRHPITGQPILFAPERSSRPRAFGDESIDRCPFCAGHEADTPPAILERGEPWRVRVFPNKYPPVPGAEVIVESPLHEATFDALPHADEIVRVYVERYRAHRDAQYIALFKNEGRGAGASIPHLHSQLMPLSFVPPRIAHEKAAFARADPCPLCELDGAILRETASFRWIAPHGSAMPYQQWIVPKRHVGELTALDEGEIAQMAALLQAASKAMQTLGDSYNWLFMNFADAPSAHFYVELFPRLARLGGFELGTGAFVQIVDPEVAADRLQGRA